MAYGLKYIARYKNVDGVVRTIQLKADGYAGSLLAEWDTNLEGPIFDWGNSDSLFGNVITTSQAKLEFLFEQEYELTDFVADKRTYLCEINDGPLISDPVIWSGWIEPWDTKHGYKKPNYFVTMTASCGLNRLKEGKFFISDNNQNELTQWEIIQRCLSTIGIDRIIRVSVHTIQNAYPSAPNPMTSVKLDIYRYFTDNKEWLACDQILADILNHYNAEICLYENKWAIIGKVDHALDVNTFIDYAIGGGQSGVAAWSDLDRTVNGTDSLTLDGSTIFIQSAIRKYSASVDFGGPRIRLQNGGMQLWNIDGLIGWNFNLGPLMGGSAGWEKVVTGLANTPFALKIKGKAPKPYTTSRKKGVWPFRKTVVSFKQPSSFVESAPIEIKRTDTTVTVSFDYYTEAGSDGFLYSIYIHTDEARGKYPEDLWYKPASYGTLITNEYTHNVAPAHPLVDPVTGAKNSKGKVEVVFQTKEFNNNPWVSGSGTPFYSYAKVRFYFSLDSGVGDEYTIYGLNASEDAASAPDSGDNQYTVTIQDKNEENTDGETINLISGDYSMEFIGTTFVDFVPEEVGSTGKWRRRSNDENVSIYRAVLLDRLGLTWKPRNVYEGRIKILPGESTIGYLNRISLSDFGDKKFKIVRYSYEEYRRIATVTCVELNYTDLLSTDVKQTTYTEGRGLLDSGLTETGESDGGDGIYPEKSIPTGRIGAEEDFLPTEENGDETGIGGRKSALFNAITPMHFVANVLSSDTVDLTTFFSDLYLEEQDPDLDPDFMHDPKSFSLKVVGSPSWIKTISIDWLTVTAKALAPDAGTYYIYVDVTDSDSGVVLHEAIPVFVSSIKITPTLKDIDGDEVLGILPGTFKLVNPWDIFLNVTGYHNNVIMKLTGPDGVLMDEYMYAPGGESELSIYRAFPGTDGTTSEAGLYSLFVEIEANMIKVLTKTYPFTLYTDEFLSKSKFELWNAAKIGDISIQDDSKFKYPTWWSERAIIADLEHDKVILTQSYEGADGWEEVKVTTFDLVSSETDGEYDVYDSPQVGQLAGNYRIHERVELAGDVVMERQNDYAILPKPAVAEGGISLVEMIANTANYDIIQEIPLTGMTINLPVRGFNALCTTVGGEVDYLQIEYFRKISNQFTLFDVTKYTKKPNFVVFQSPVSEFEVLAFDVLSSLDIADIHEAPSGHRFRFTGRIGGESGDIVGIKQADVSFRVPIDEADLSGLRFINVHHLTGEVVVVDSDMPKVGGSYPLPVYPWFWSVAFRKLKSNEEFDTVSLAMDKDGVDLHNAPYGTDVVDYPVLMSNGYWANVTTELHNDKQAYIFGTFSVDHRTLLNPSNSPVNIDVPSDVIIAASPYRSGVLLEVINASFELTEPVEETPETDPGECCVSFTQIIGDGSATDYLVNHMLDSTKLHVTFREVADGTEVFIENKPTTSNQIIVKSFGALALNSIEVIVEK